jgi:nicotinamide-nucleotide amidase
MQDRSRIALVADIGGLLRGAGWWLATAESCTGGLIGHLVTDLPGSSEFYLGGVVSYANVLKTGLLGVPEEVLRRAGAVSAECVRAMVRGACERLGAQAAVAVSGIAGPTGGTKDKPVGTVWLAWRTPACEEAECFRFAGDRAAVKMAAAETALEGLRLRLARDKGA